MTTVIRYGLDVGERRIGVARQDSHTHVVLPVETIYRIPEHDGTDDIVDLIEGSEDVLAADAKLEFIIGLPRLMSGEIGKQARDVLHWSASLSKKFPQSSIRLIDERLSSVSAHRDLRAAGRKTHQHKTVVDQQAAVIILQLAIDTTERSGKPAGIPLVDLLKKEGITSG